MVLLVIGQQVLLDAAGVQVVKDLIGHYGVFGHYFLGFLKFIDGEVAYPNVSDLSGVDQFLNRRRLSSAAHNTWS